MASTKAVTATLKLLGRVFAGDVTPEKAALYAAALEDLSDERVAASVAILVKTHAGQFLPVPAQIRDACGANARPAVDVDAARNAIKELGGYTPELGWCAPSVGVVRERLGDALADAYGAVGGGAQLFPRDDATGRSIALREFGKELAVAEERVARRALGGGRQLALAPPAGDAA